MSRLDEMMAETQRWWDEQDRKDADRDSELWRAYVRRTDISQSFGEWIESERQSAKR